MNSCAAAARAAASTSASLASGRPKRMFSRAEAAKITGSCGTSANCRRRSVRAISRISTPSSVIRPASGSKKRRRSWKIVVLPAPEGPTSATVSPGLIRRPRSWSAGASGRAG